MGSAIEHLVNLEVFYGAMNTTSESLLIRLQGLDHSIDQVAWEQFVALYTPLIFYWSRKMGLEQNDAADLVQDVLARVFQNLPKLQYDATKSFRGWLRQVTMNRYREIRRRKSLQIENGSESLIHKLPSVEQAESTWDIDYARLLVAQAMEGMEENFDPQTWRALLQVMNESKTVEQASQETDVSPWTIYSARSRLMKRLRDKLEGLL